MKKMLTLFAALMCAATMLFAQEDTRTVISECAFTGTPTAVVAGEEWYERWSFTDGWFTPVTPDIYHVSQYMYLEKKDGEEWEGVANGSIITEGEYRFSLQLRIDDNYEAENSYRLQDDGSLVMTVDGVNWDVTDVEVNKGPSYFYSYVWVTSPVMKVEKVVLPLRFTYLKSLDYTVNYINQAIETKDLKEYTTGGTESYTYAKTTNKAPWFKVSSDGIVSGTPTEIFDQAVLDSVRVSDGKNDTVVALYVGPVAPLPEDREVVSTVSFTNFNTPKVGDIYSIGYVSDLVNALVRPANAVYKIEDGVNVSINKKDGEEWASMAQDEVFAEGDYMMAGQLRIDNDESFVGYYYMLDHEDNIIATIDGKAMQIYSGYEGDSFSYRVFEFVFTVSKATGIESVQKSEFRIQKVLRDGQVLILRDGKTFTVTGQEVK